jgi:hypothetical protein
MYNLRYHIASLVAVFLALSVGLLLGTVVVERGVLNAQKTSLVQGLQKDYDRLRSDIVGLTTRAETLDAFAGEAEKAVVKDVLTGKTIIVLTDPSSADVVKLAVDAIRDAGGTAGVATLTEPGLALANADVLQAAATALAVPEASLDATRVTAELAREWTTPGGPRTLTNALVAVGAIRLESFSAPAAADGVVVASVWNGEPDATALALARAASGPGRSAVGVETTKRTTGLAAAAVTAGLSGVDDLDDVLGRVSMVWLVAGRATGLYGTGKDAEGRYPSPLFPAQ